MKSKSLSTKESRNPMLNLSEMDVGCVKSHFLDSGAFSLWKWSLEWAKTSGKSRWEFYDTVEHWHFLDSYAEFVKKYKRGIDLYANMDVIGNPGLTYRNQKYLEQQHGLSPIPVVHFRSPLSWLEQYMKDGHKLIGLGGMAGRGTSKVEACRRWCSDCFDLVCDTPSRLPKVGLHGFGITNYRMLTRYPWKSVDSSGWVLLGSCGGILIPRLHNDIYQFMRDPLYMQVAVDSPYRKQRGRHIHNIPKESRKVVERWLDEIQVPLGTFDKEGKTIELGVTTHDAYRKAANIRYFEKLRRSLPKYPWPFPLSKERKAW